MKRWLFCLCVGLVLSGCGRQKTPEAYAAQARAGEAAARLEAIRALAGSESADLVVPVMTDALKDSDYYVRRDAARALRKFRGEARQAVPALVVAARDQEPSVRRAATEALKEIDPEAARKKLRCPGGR